jgi:acyl-CoA thioesterase FadM
MIVARRERRVEWGDCDPARIVFNPRFFEWFDAQTALIFETIGLPKRDLLQGPTSPAFRWSRPGRASIGPCALAT